jgi:hypothetical protein
MTLTSTWHMSHIYCAMNYTPFTVHLPVATCLSSLLCACFVCLYACTRWCQERLGVELELVRAKHKPFTFHGGTHSTDITLEEGCSVARRRGGYRYGALVFSADPVPADPVYYEVRLESIRDWCHIYCSHNESHYCFAGPGGDQ